MSNLLRDGREIWIWVGGVNFKRLMACIDDMKGGIEYMEAWICKHGGHHVPSAPNSLSSQKLQFPAVISFFILFYFFNFWITRKIFGHYLKFVVDKFCYCVISHKSYIRDKSHREDVVQLAWLKRLHWQ